MNPTISEVSKRYWEEQTDGRYRHQSEESFQKYAQEMRALLIPGGVLADAGCGSCDLMPYMASSYDTVYAFDYSQSMLASAEKRLKVFGISNVNLFQGTVAKFPEQVKPVDAVITNSVIQYMEPEEISHHLVECARVLRPNGMVLLGTIPNQRFEMLYHLGWMGKTPPKGVALVRKYMRVVRYRKKVLRHGDHLWDGVGRWFSKEQIQDLADKAGFDADMRNSWFFEYRFHALLTKRA